MSIEADIRGFLLERVAPEAGVWYMTVPQGTDVGRGAIVLQRVATTRTYALDGATGMVETTLQIDCWADRAADAIALADAVIRAVHSFAHPTPSEAVVGATHVHMMTVDGVRDVDEPELPHHRRSIDVTVTYKEV